MSDAESSFKEYWGEEYFPDSLKKFAKEIFIAGFNYGSVKPTYLMNREQYMAIEKIVMEKIKNERAK